MNISKLLIGILLFLVFAAIGAGLWFILRPQIIINNPIKTPQVTTPTLAPEDEVEVEMEDAVPTTQPSPTSEPETQSSDDEEIRQAMANKYSKDISEVNLTVSDNDGNYAKGGVTFAGEMGGGWWLATVVGGNWVIVADGNGTVMCDDIDPYNFPISFVPECWDETTQTLITR